jgi:hypothetical protein
MTTWQENPIVGENHFFQLSDERIWFLKCRAVLVIFCMTRLCLGKQHGHPKESFDLSAAGDGAVGRSRGEGRASNPVRTHP